MLAVASVLVGVVCITHGGWLELVGAGAVLLSFGHAQVADRLAEREASREVQAVDCHRWATRYLVGKESLWLVYFVLHHSWSALAGVALFLVYSPWRRWWRVQRPLDRDLEYCRSRFENLKTFTVSPSKPNPFIDRKL